MEGKKSFIAYCDWLDLIEDLEDAEAGQILKWLLNYVNDKEPTPPSEKHLKIVCKVIKSQLKEDLEKWKETIEIKREAGRKGGLATQSKNKQNQAEPSTTKQSQANQAVYDNVNVNDSDNVIYGNKLPVYNNTHEEEENIEALKNFLTEIETMMNKAITGKNCDIACKMYEKYGKDKALYEIKNNLDKNSPILYAYKVLENEKVKKGYDDDLLLEDEWLKGFNERNK